jgi:hypothetical protein
MLTFFRTSSCRRCDEIQEILDSDCLAYQVIIVPGGDAPGYRPMGARPPVLADGDAVIQGAERIMSHLGELRRFKSQWEKYQSDSCYVE